MIFVTSDIHCFHKQILKFCPESRPYESVDEMHNEFRKNWNRKIAPEDTTYIIGDVTFGRIAPTVDILRGLNGNKILIAGNHDKDQLRKASFRDCFISVHDYLELKYDGHLICMMHYPIMHWNKSHYGSIMLHGHLHGNPSNVPGRIKDVGFDTNFCTPYSMDEVLEEMLAIPLPEKKHHDINL